MHILLSTHHLMDFAGSEIFTYVIAKYLVKMHQHVVVYCRYIDKMSYLFKKANIPIYNSISQLKSMKFDVAHVHHNINAFEIRYNFPKLPMVFLSHGVLPFLEQPPHVNIGISKYLAVSEEVKNNLIEKGIEENNIEILRNFFDDELFKELKPIHRVPKKALIISSRLDRSKEKIIKESLEKLKIKYKFIGSQYEVVSPLQIPKLINESDIVFSLGRGIIGAMACGRIPIVYDYLGGDGLVTSKNVFEIMKNNYSGRRYHHQYTVNGLIKEIKKYNKDDAQNLKKIAIQYHSAKNNVNNLIEIYKKVKNQKIQLSKINRDYFRIYNIRNIISETYNYSSSLLEREKNKYRNELNVIKNSKFYKLWRKYDYLKSKFILKN